MKPKDAKGSEKRIREELILARNEKSWTQSEAAQEIGTDHQSLSRWERGLVEPRQYYIRKMCDLYKKSARELGFIRKEKEEILIREDTIDDISFPKQDLTIQLVAITIASRSKNIKQIQSEISQMVENMDKQNREKDYQMKRREAIMLLASLPLALITQQSYKAQTYAIDEMLPNIAAGITACMYLSKLGHSEISVAHRSLSSYAPNLQAIVRESSIFRKEAADLAAQCFLLLATISIHKEGAQSAERYASKAKEYSNVGDNNTELHLTILRRTAWIYSCNKKFAKAEETMQEAVHLLKQAKKPSSATIHTSVYGAFAKYRTQNGQKDTIIVEYKEGGEVGYTDYNLSNYTLDKGLTFYNLGQYKKAYQTYTEAVDPETANSRILTSSQRIHAEILNTMTMASLKLPHKEKDKELSISLWRAGIQLAKSLQSEQRFEEVLTTHHIMQALWPQDSNIIALSELLTHW